MAKQVIPQYSFNGGEYSPRMYGRGDYEPYSKALKTATNCYITAHGPVIRRSGSKYIAEVKDSTKTTRLIPFIFDNSGDALVLEFGHNYIRFIKAGSVLGAPYEVATTYTSTEVNDIDYVQYGNILYLAHPNHAPAQLIRTTDTDWTLSDIGLYPPPSYEEGYTPPTTVTPAATTGTSVNFTAGAATWLQGDIGRQIVNLSGDGIAVITKITSSTVAVADILEDFPSTSAISSGDWKLDLSPISSLSFEGSPSAGNVITVISRPPNIPDIFNGDFLNSASGWDNISAGTGTAGWNSTNRTLQLVGAGAGNEGKAEQSIESTWDGNFTLVLDCDNGVTVNVGTSTGATDITTSSIAAGLNKEVNFTLNNNTDTIYIGFSSTATVNIDNVRLTATYDTFRSADQGRYIIVNGGVLFTKFLTNAYTMQCEVTKSLNSSEDSLFYTLESTDWTSARGYPSKVSLFQERLIFANTATNPTGVWMSEVGIFNGFGIGPDDEDSIQSTLAASDISWMKPARDLVIGCSDKELAILGSTSGSAITSSNIRQIPRTYYGSDSQRPINIGTEIVFIQGTGKKLRAMSYDFTSDGYRGDDLIFLAEHMPNTITALSYGYNPDSVIYAVDSSGDMLTGVYEREQSVIGWSRYSTEGSYESTATIPTSDADHIYVIVNRTINGTTKRYIERFENQDGTGILHGYSDSYLTYDAGTAISGITKADPGVVTSTSHGLSDGDRVKMIGVGGMTEVEGITYVVANKTANTFELNDEYGNNIDTSSFTTYTSGGYVHKLVTTISGLTHLEGKEVQVKADGAVHANKTVSSGSITLDRSAYNVVVGLPYTTTIATLNTQWNTNEGIMQGQLQRKVRVYVRVYASTIPLLNETNFIPSRNGDDLMDTSVPLFTGDLEYGSTNWNTAGSVSFTVSDPLPFQLQALFIVTEGNVK
jgi:hypothetical protein